MRRTLFAFLAVASLALGGLTVANAASLSVDGGSVTTAHGSSCTTSTVSLTRIGQMLFWYSGVRVSNIPQSCWNLPIQISANNGSVAATLPGGATSGSVDISTGWYWATVRDFSIVFDGWYVPAGRAS